MTFGGLLSSSPSECPCDQPGAGSFTPRWTGLAILVAIVVGPLAGCSQELGPEFMPTAPVRGRVVENGRPVRQGWVEFFPVDGTIGNLCSAPIEPDGSFHLPQAPVGWNLVRLVNVPLESESVRRLLGAFHSPIRRQVPPGGVDSLLIDAVEEMRLFKERGFPDIENREGA